MAPAASRHRADRTAPPRERTGARLALWIAVAALVVVVRLATGELEPLPWERARDVVTLSTSVFLEAFPFVVLGVALSALLRAWADDSLVRPLIDARPWLRRLAVSVLGAVIPVCECGNVPLARGLLARGLPVPDVIAFTLAAPLIAPVTILTTAQAFGWTSPILLIRVIGGFAVAHVVAALVARWGAPPPPAAPADGGTAPRIGAVDGLPAPLVAVDGAHPAGAGAWRRALTFFSREIPALVPALAGGSLVAGLIQVCVGRDALTDLGSSPVASVIAGMVLAFVVSVCSTVDAFFILALGSAFLPGGIVSFLVFGAMIDIKMLALLRTTFTTRVVACTAIGAAGASLLLGLVVNLVMTR
ncbi:permease [Actinomyces sp. B33]|uniref:permease n=1 Tax=Actinomyces sp. B33 TaxID=2942131 RepID=UPI0023402449|nr:permease [Actinomyces sp. B33]MDC4232726.1 permease [Actinomyces sp. B33]